MSNLSHLTPAQRQSYDTLVAELRAAKSAEQRIAARERAMEEGPGDLLYVKKAMAQAEVDADTPEAKWRLVLDELAVKDEPPKAKHRPAPTVVAANDEGTPEGTEWSPPDAPSGIPFLEAVAT